MTTRGRPRVLAVSEDPDYIQDLRGAVEERGATLVACLGPAASPCFLDKREVCPLAASSDIVLIDAPPSGCFKNHSLEIEAGDYAERLQRAHPDILVVLVAPIEGAGPTGEVMVTEGRTSAYLLLDQLLQRLEQILIEPATGGGGLR